MLLSSCGSLPPPTPPPKKPAVSATPPTFVRAPIEEAAPQMLIAEREASIAGDLTLLATLWAPDARVVDAKTSAEPEDDYVWAGREAVLDRYAMAVFPSPPPPLPSTEGIQIVQTDDSAIVENGNDRWVLRQRQGRWWLQELTYNRPTH